MTTMDRITADISARTGATGKELEALVLAAGFIMAALADNDAAARHFAERFNAKAGG